MELTYTKCGDYLIPDLVLATISFLTLCYRIPKSTISGNMAGCAVPT